MLTAFVALGYVSPWMILGFSFFIACGAMISPGKLRPATSSTDAMFPLPSPSSPSASILSELSARRSAASWLPSPRVLTAFVITTLTCLVPLATIWRCKWNVRSSPLPRGSMRTAIYDGLRFTGMSSEIGAAIARGTLFGLASIAILALLPLVVRDQVGGGPLAYGTLMAGIGTGAGFAGISNTTFRWSLSQERLMRLSCIACAACSLSLALTSSIAVAAIALALGGAGWVTAWSGVGVSVQLASPRAGSWDAQF